MVLNDIHFNQNENEFIYVRIKNIFLKIWLKLKYFSLLNFYVIKIVYFIYYVLLFILIHFD